MPALTDDQVAFFRRNGYHYPVNALSAEEAAQCRARIEQYEKDTGEEVNKRLKIKAHLASPWMCELARHPEIVSAVQSIIGPDVLLFGSSAFAKNAQDKRFVSWHQDSAYYGLSPNEEVTVWIALSPATSESGCLRVLPGSHEGPDLVHEETYDPDNLLARGQSLRGIDDTKAVEMPLQPGQFSMHHERTAHDSLPNQTDDRRIGMAFFYMPAHVKSTMARRSAMHISGEDRYGHWDVDPEPQTDLDPVTMAYLDSIWGDYRDDSVTVQASRSKTAAAG
ncbi:phytanoyl-CoA dioxygenase family protein [Acuticoccus sp. MNP-M23]|uniref:phytanoyl-CoA dioxygenase family protein n=1 Tax=Acuticoccus sp. MNP-M23 TaxID=3072793 RepID=UPI0028152BA4|nr:phytanoyl-CoA dioxygenase family protein [Acuticoccus sp. MNP-M23]WMS41333.1 phytanoyl-CoA dioxygenase family protein [Acuticoccus sp. MNP-M23]